MSFAVSVKLFDLSGQQCKSMCSCDPRNTSVPYTLYGQSVPAVPYALSMREVSEPMEPGYPDDVLREHRRRHWWPWRCRCGSRYPCGPRQNALDEQLRLVTREVVDWYPTYFARDAHAESSAQSTAQPER